MKKIKLCASVLALCVAVCVMTVGIFAASGANVSIGANVSYTALGNVKATLELSHSLTPSDKVSFKPGTGGITASKTVNSAPQTGNENVMDGTVNTAAKININGAENDVSGNFALGEIEIEAAEGYAGDVSYTYTLKITNNYAADDLADNKSLKVSFTQPTAAKLATNYQAGHTWIDIKNGDTIVGKSAVLAAGVTAIINVTFATQADISGAANLASSIVLESVSNMIPPIIPTIIQQNITAATTESVVVSLNNTTAYNIEYSLDSKQTWKLYNDTEKITMLENGDIYFRHKDNNNNTGPIYKHTVSNIDKTPPIVNNLTVDEITSYSIILSVDANDASTLGYNYKINNGDFEFSNSNSHMFTNLKHNQTYNITVQIMDSAGNATTQTTQATTLEIPNYDISKIVVSDSLDHNALIELRSIPGVNTTNFILQYSFNDITYTDYASTIKTSYTNENDGMRSPDKNIFVRYKDASGQASTTTIFKKLELKLSYLTIGNSFSADSMRMIPQIATQLGYTNLELGYLYAAGRGIDDHIKSFNDNASDYNFFQYNPARKAWENNTSWSLENTVKLLDWNIIVFQQRSADSGFENTYSNLGQLVNIIDSIKTNQNSRYAFNMTWAYQVTPIEGVSTVLPGFFGTSQEDMYNKIVSSVQNKVVPLNKIPTIIPTGTTVQNMRTSYIGDNVCAGDYKHISLDATKIANSASFIKTLSGINIDALKYATEFAGTPEKYFEIIIESANNAVLNPLAITQSAYTQDIVEDLDENGVDLNRFTKLSFEFTPYAAWNSGSNFPTATLVSQPASDTSNKFIASKSFSADLIPVGSKIIIKDRITVRFEGWVDELTKTPLASRPDNLSNYNSASQVFIVDENFIKNFTIRAINLTMGATLDDNLITVLQSRLSVYAPKTNI